MCAVSRQEDVCFGWPGLSFDLEASAGPVSWAGAELQEVMCGGQAPRARLPDPPEGSLWTWVECVADKTLERVQRKR